MTAPEFIELSVTGELACPPVSPPETSGSATGAAVDAVSVDSLAGAVSIELSPEGELACPPDSPSETSVSDAEEEVDVVSVDSLVDPPSPPSLVPASA